MDEHLGYQAYERSDNPDYRNGKKTKKIRGNFRETEIEVPQDRDGSFEPKIVKKRQKDISGIEQKIISLYSKGMTTRQISETIEDIYGFEVSDGMVSDTDVCCANEKICNNSNPKDVDISGKLLFRRKFSIRLCKMHKCDRDIRPVFLPPPS